MKSKKKVAERNDVFDEISAMKPKGVWKGKWNDIMVHCCHHKKISISFKHDIPRSFTLHAISCHLFFLYKISSMKVQSKLVGFFVAFYLNIKCSCLSCF